MWIRLMQVIYWLSVALVATGLFGWFRTGEAGGLVLGGLFWLPGFLIAFIGSGRFLLPPRQR